MLYSVSNGQSRWASFENPRAAKGAAGRENFGGKGRASDYIRAGETVSLLEFDEGPGLIHRIWATLRDRSPRMLRSLVVRAWWDGAKTPAVEAPFGDFFCCGSQLTAFENEWFSSPEGRSVNMCIPMPFAASAKITVTNESDADQPNLFYDVNLTALDRPQPDAPYFHCHWRRVRETVLGEDFELLPRVQGRGRLLGTSVVVNARPDYGRQWWGEGEVKAYIDGDTAWPTLCGTGTEDYIGTGWGQGRYSHRHQGCLMNDEELRRWVFYRLHAPDPIWFTRDIRFTIQAMGGAPSEEVRDLLARGVPCIPVTAETGTTPGAVTSDGFLYKTNKPLPDSIWVNYFRSDDYAAATWFYLDRPENGLPRIAPLAERIAGL